MLQYKFDQFVNFLILKSNIRKLYFFVEDEKKDGIYERLFRALLPDYQIEILNSGKVKNYIMEINFRGKDALMALYEKFKQLDRKIEKKINYRIIIDPDFQLYYNKPEIIEDSNLIYLKRYCIENYFIEKDLILKAIQVYYSEYILSEIESKSQLDSWFKNISQNFGILFSYFAFNYLYTITNGQSLVKKNEISMQDVTYFFLTNSYKVNLDKVKEYFNLLKQRYLSFNQDNKEEGIIDFTREFIKKINENPVKYICGKHLYHSLFFYLKKEKQLSQIPNNITQFMNTLFIIMIDNYAKILFNFIN